MRPIVKRLAEAALWRSGLPRLARGAARRRVVLAYHNVLPPGAAAGADRSLHLQMGTFERQLDLLQRDATVVPLREILAGPARHDGRPTVAITFDDAYRGAVTVAAGVLAARGLAATIFVTPAMLGDPGFWWDALGAAAGFEDGLRERLLTECRGEERRVRALAAAKGLPVAEPPPAARPATVEELRAAAILPGITLASHTWSHPNLALLAPPEVREELRRPREWFTAQGLAAEPYLTYPYGRWSPEVARVAEGAGYEAAFRVDGGALPDGAHDRFALPRLNVPAGLSAEGLGLRIAGLLRA